MHSVINNIVKSTEKRIQRIENEADPEENGSIRTEKRDIVKAITDKKSQNKVAVIAEVKPASPGKKLRDIMPDDAVMIAKEMEKAGAIAISVLTEPEFFHGSLNNLEAVRKEVSLPVLRKDFIINKVQFNEIESDLILLIAGILRDNLDEMVNLAIAKGFEPLVEVHNQNELEEALKTKARLIGINNRNLSTLEIDLDTTLKLAPIIKEYDINNNLHHTIISESGMHNIEDIKMVIEAGADAVLVGTSIIKSGDIYAKTKELVDALD
ncbi:indole-3-glycerol-phosphate synthase [Methanolobus mangrovi]|uniref:indole-3-glycerol-phosphate synthase n=1 Tax=Methanolobus mangrovi TaxID=3072977 RepID=A0AA51YHI1_9EURY|nr:indole-3-glycerol-phosphate synthase [Methanolobus mangrovi]WMW23177.1 indole-3-glycerol-phosphate synthase [Methanolobus mangrovi]